MNQKLVLRGLAAACAVGTLVVLPAIPAGADEPLQQGWWTATNPGSVPAQAPPDVPSDGLLVQGGAHGPSAFAALIYTVSDGATIGKLTLAVSRPSATTPSAALQVCPLDSASITPEQGGPMSEAPTYNCTTKVTASPDKSGNTYSFDVASLVTQGALAIAVLPPDPTTRVVFSKPGPSSLTVTQQVAQPPPPPPLNSAPVPTSNPAPLAPAGGASLAAAPPVQSGPSLPAPATTPPQPQVAPTPTATTTQGTGGFAAASTGSGPGKASPAAVGLALGGVAAAAALWAYAGRNKEGSSEDITPEQA